MRRIPFWLEPDYPEKEKASFAQQASEQLEHARTTGDEHFILSRMTSALTGRHWLTQAGNYIYPEDMTNKHLLATVKMIEEGRAKRPGCSGRSNAEWLEIFRTELSRRGVKSDGTKVPI